MPRAAEIIEADVYHELSLYDGKTLREITESIRQKKKMRADPTAIIFSHLYSFMLDEFATRRERQDSIQIGSYEYLLTPKGAENCRRYAQKDETGKELTTI